MTVMKAVIVVTPMDCYSGTCDCECAAECKFPRCPNCDNPMDEHGKALDNGRSPSEYHICPDCNGDLR